jgi:hypothetical protein
MYSKFFFFIPYLTCLYDQSALHFQKLSFVLFAKTGKFSGASFRVSLLFYPKLATLMKLSARTFFGNILVRLLSRVQSCCQKQHLNLPTTCTLCANHSRLCLSSSDSINAYIPLEADTSWC